jgi:hypothetical protein
MAKRKKKAHKRRGRVRPGLGALNLEVAHIEDATSKGECSAALENLLTAAGTLGFEVAVQSDAAQEDMMLIRHAMHHYVKHCVIKK